MTQGLPTNPIYSGTFERSRDAKNRVTIPAKWLSQEEEEFQVVPNTRSGFLMVMPPAEFIRVESRLMEAASQSVSQRRAAVKEFYSSAHGVATDKQGRILLPEDQCQKAKLNGDLVLVGVKDRFEIWDKARWEAVAKENAALFEQACEEIGL